MTAQRCSTHEVHSGAWNKTLERITSPENAAKEFTAQAAKIRHQIIVDKRFIVEEMKKKNAQEQLNLRAPSRSIRLPLRTQHRRHSRRTCTLPNTQKPCQTSSTSKRTATPALTQDRKKSEKPSKIKTSTASSSPPAAQECMKLHSDEQSPKLDSTVTSTKWLTSANSPHGATKTTLKQQLNAPKTRYVWQLRKSA